MKHQKADQDGQKTKAVPTLMEKVVAISKLKIMINRFLRATRMYAQKTKAQLTKRYIELAEEQ